MFTFFSWVSRLSLIKLFVSKFLMSFTSHCILVTVFKNKTSYHRSIIGFNCCILNSYFSLNTFNLFFDIGFIKTTSLIIGIFRLIIFSLWYHINIIKYIVICYSINKIYEYITNSSQNSKMFTKISYSFSIFFFICFNTKP